MRYANATQITDALWIGGDLETHRDARASVQLAELITVGITDIIDCRIEWDDHDWVAEKAPDMTYLCLGIDDAGQVPDDGWFDTGTQFVIGRIRAGGRVLAHCHMGINRGPSMGFATLLALGWEPIAALDRIRQRRPIAHVAYAEDALEWWLRKQGANAVERAEGRHAISAWRARNDLDVASVIRRMRQREII